MAVSELQRKIIAIRDSQLEERKKKESDDLPVIRAVAEAKKSSRNVPLSRFVVASQFCWATFFRYGCRAELGLPLWGPRGKPKAVTIEDDIVQDVLKSQRHGGINMISSSHSPSEKFSQQSHFADCSGKDGKESGYFGYIGYFISSFWVHGPVKLSYKIKYNPDMENNLEDTLKD